MNVIERESPSGVVPYVLAAAFASTAYIASFTAAALAAPAMSGERATSGLPNAFGIGGTALAAVVLSAVMARRGRRFGLTLGFALGALGALGAALSVVAGSLPLLLAASVALGIGNGALQLARYAAADHVPTHRRAAVVGIVVWGSTAGAVIGPNLLVPAEGLADLVARSRLETAFWLVLIIFVAATLVGRIGVPAAAPATGPIAAARPARGPRIPIAGLLAAPRSQVAVSGLLGGQAVMTLLMTMTPIHVLEAGHGTAGVGLVISAHTLGMFALAPVSGRLAVRFGAVPVILAGYAVLAAAAAVAATAAPHAVLQLMLALFLLGYGWNLSFVAASSLLTRGATEAERIRLQGVGDAIAWSGAAAASIAAGPLLDAVGYGMLAVVAGALLAVPALAVLLRGGGMDRPAPAAA